MSELETCVTWCVREVQLSDYSQGQVDNSAIFEIILIYLNFKKIMMINCRENNGDMHSPYANNSDYDILEQGKLVLRTVYEFLSHYPYNTTVKVW